MLKTVHLMRVSAMFVKLWTMLYKCITTQTYAYAYGFTSAGRLWMRLSLRYNGLFRSFSNYRVDNKGFDSRGPARSRPLRVLSIWKQDGRKNETLKKDETRKLWKGNGKSGRRTKKNEKEHAFQLDGWKKYNIKKCIPRTQ